MTSAFVAVCAAIGLDRAGDRCGTASAFARIEIDCGWKSGLPEPECRQGFCRMAGYPARYGLDGVASPRHGYSLALLGISPALVLAEG